MPRYQNYQPDDEDDDNQQPVRRGQQQDDNENDNDNDNDNDGNADQQSMRGAQQQQEDIIDDEDDIDDINRQRKRRQQVGDNDDDDENQKPQAGQQDDSDDDDEIPFPPASPPPDNDNDDDDDDDDGQKSAKSATVNLKFNINLNLDNSDLHEGGTIFSKKLLAQLFSGPGGHNPREKDIGVHDIQHEHVETHESEEWTIVELKAEDASGATIYLKAKLDSGADDNFMSFDIYKVTGLDFTPYEGPEGPPSFTTGSGEVTEPIGTVRLTYTAGVKPQKFIETFQVLEGLPHDVIIGKPFMTNAHMIMVDPNFAHPPEHKNLALLELPQKDKDSKAKAIAFQQQRAAEQKAAYEAKIQAQEAAAPKAHKKNLFGRHK